MRKIISIAFLYLRTTYTSIGTLLFTIAMPIIFTFVLALTMKGMAGEPTPEAWQLLIANEDKSNLSASLIMHLEENPILDVEIAEKNSTLADVESGDALALLLIPSGFETNAFQHDATDLTLYQSADSIARAQILEEAVKSASAEIGGSLAIADLSLRVAEEIALINKSDEDGKQDYKEEAFEAAQSAWQTDEIINLQL